MWLRAAANWRELIPGITSIFSFGKFLSLAILKTVFKTPENPGSPVDNIDTVLFVTYSQEKLGYRLLDDDMITIYGETFGVYSYESTGSGVITIPWILADIIEM